MADTFYDVITAAINEVAEHGYDSAERIAYWTMRIRDAAEKTMASQFQMQQMLRDALAAVYRSMVDKGELARYHGGVARFTIEKLRPQLRAELDRRIAASAELIKLNRKNAIEKTLQRFAGWSTSVPAGGSEAVDKRETKGEMRKALASLPFQERRVLIDQGHKLRASLSEVVARDGKAIALIWKSRWRQAGYDYREDHKERDGNVYLLRSSWAQEAGLVKVGADGYYEDITAVGEEPYCRCYATWIYNLRDLPDDMLTAKGRAVLAAAKAQLA